MHLSTDSRGPRSSPYGVSVAIPKDTFRNVDGRASVIDALVQPRHFVLTRDKHLLGRTDGTRRRPADLSTLITTRELRVSVWQNGQVVLHVPIAQVRVCHDARLSLSLPRSLSCHRARSDDVVQKSAAVTPAAPKAALLAGVKTKREKFAESVCATMLLYRVSAVGVVSINAVVAVVGRRLFASTYLDCLGSLCVTRARSE